MPGLSGPSPRYVGFFALVALPLQILTIGYVAAIFAATSRRSPVATASLAVGAIAGASADLSVHEVVNATGDIGQILFLIVLAMTLVTRSSGLLAGRRPGRCGVRSVDSWPCS